MPHVSTRAGMWGVLRAHCSISEAGGAAWWVTSQQRATRAGSSHVHPHFSPGASREGQALPLLSRGSFPAWVAGTGQGCQFSSHTWWSGVRKPSPSRPLVVYLPPTPVVGLSQADLDDWTGPKETP